jgi:hypothetical protein
MNDEGLACGIIAGDAFYPASPGAAAWIASACTPPANSKAFTARLSALQGFSPQAAQPVAERGLALCCASQGRD